MVDSRIRRTANWVPKACDICGEAERLTPLGRRWSAPAMQHAIFELNLDDVICERCGFVFVQRIPEGAFLFDYYAESPSGRSDYQTLAADFDADARLATIRKHLAPGSSIFEVGAGDGEFCDILASAGFAATGIDPIGSDRRESVSQAFVAVGESAARAGTFDAVAAYFVLEHVVSPRAWIEETKVHLKPGGLLIVEVPNFERWPGVSLNENHFLHFTPAHLALLLEGCGLHVVELLPDGASRYFGMLAVARLLPANQVPAVVWPDGEECARLVEMGKARYREAREFFDAEAARLRAIAGEAARRAAARRPQETEVIVWGANVYATELAQRLREAGLPEPSIVDNVAAKVGSQHEGFVRPIAPPVFEKRVPAHRIFIPCSRTWNDQIIEQIKDLALYDIAILDGIRWSADAAAP